MVYTPEGESIKRDFHEVEYSVFRSQQWNKLSVKLQVPCFPTEFHLSVNRSKHLIGTIVSGARYKALRCVSMAWWHRSGFKSITIRSRGQLIIQTLSQVSSNGIKHRPNGFNPSFSHFHPFYRYNVLAALRKCKPPQYERRRSYSYLTQRALRPFRQVGNACLWFYCFLCLLVSLFSTSVRTYTNFSLLVYLISFVFKGHSFAGDFQPQNRRYCIWVQFN